MEQKIEVRAVFRGRVQGVGFRATVRHLAHRLDVHGTVRNLADGTVEMIAQGKKEDLEILIQDIKEEFGSYIQSLQATYSPAARLFDGFSISF